ncbi:hypothetical protein AAHE18_10G212900 [Arachis hypogaea]
MPRRIQLFFTQEIIIALQVSSLLFFFSCSLTVRSVHGDYPSRANIFVYAGCSQDKYQPNSIFEENLNTFLSSVVSSSSEVTYNSFAIGNGTSAPAEATVYGMYQCRGDLHPTDCSKCIGRSVNQIGLVCPYTTGASLQLEGCYLRYEHSGDFLGKLDTSVRYKKCSKSVDNDVEFFRRRDDVLMDLQTANGFKLKSMCGSAAAADVFLGQCYARYWASGYYDETPGSHNNDEVGRSVAIIVGVFTGLAVLVVLLSICKKAMG